MDLDKDDLAVLCEGMTREEVDRVHRLLHQWNVGPEDSFPTQLSLLTLAQLRAAASVPRAVTDARNWLDQHLAEYRRETKGLVDDFNRTVQTRTREVEATVAAHAKAVEQAAAQIQAQIHSAEEVAGRVKSLMANATSQWEAIKTGTTVQCERLQKVSDDLQERFAWRVILQFAAFFVLVSALSVLAGHYLWKP